MGGRRRRRKVIRKVVKKPPKVFRCPSCDAVSVTVNDKEEDVIVACSNCGLILRTSKVRNYEPVHYYNIFVDKYYAGQLNVGG
ncbi:MAG: hypothetical protein N3F04_04770 [Candidatus Nezhaarchaeota archaeon]|nr:hypothetical protein [Candidatus Nezhaarchaeota archaeon]MCX8142065.1 hypothetical protein [Candidatus Nezhaarchaeota archaeon]MDW8050154.1 hypothetical protein [Nitrososphaerota archaeon]